MDITTLAQVETLPRVHWENRDMLPPVSGLYFVVANARVIYIGKSVKSLRERWRQHPLRRVFEADGVFEVAYTRVACPDDLKAAEKRAVRAMRPDHNVHYVEGALAHSKEVRRRRNRPPSPTP